MTGGRRAIDDTGSALVEFVGLTALLLVPVAYLVLVAARVQAASYAVDAAARSAARAVTAAPDEATGRARAAAAVRLALRDQGFAAAEGTTSRVECSASPCLTPGATVRVEIVQQVALPGLPAILARWSGASVTVRSSATDPVDAFRITAPGAG